MLWSINIYTKYIISLKIPMDTINLIEYTLGFYMLTMGISLLINKKSWKNLLKALSKDKVFLKIAGAVTLGLGLICVFAISSLETKIVLQIIVWLMVIKWVLGLLITPKMYKKMVDPMIHSDTYLQISAIVSILLGLYLIIL